MVWMMGAVILLASSCKKDPDPEALPPEAEPLRAWVSAADFSFYPEIRDAGVPFYNSAGQPADPLELLQLAGVNTVRLRLWVDPVGGRSGFSEVKQFSEELHDKGFQTWLTVHYSESWADPANQVTPQRWQGLSLAALQDSVYGYTRRVVADLEPDLIQVGNEINNGFLYPQGHLIDAPEQFLALADTAIAAVRRESPSTRIVLHYGSLTGAAWFFDQVQALDYDLMALSYYPIWHGTDLNFLSTILQQISETHKKDILLAETAYPFTLGWEDATNNIVGLNDHLILPDYPATPAGQQAFVARIKSIVADEVTRGMGMCYWGGDWVAWKGESASDGSTWENQALFDFDHKALPALQALGSP